MSEVKAVDRPPESSPRLMFDERRPFLKRPVIDRVQHLIERHGGCERREPTKEPRKRRKEQVEQRKRGRHEQRKRSECIPGEERSLALLLFDDWKFVLNKKHAPPVPRGFARDARQRVVQRVLPVQPLQTGTPEARRGG